MPEKIRYSPARSQWSQTVLAMDIHSPSMRIDPYTTYARMRELSPVCRLNPMGLWCINDYDSARRALKDFEVFSSAATHNLLQPSWFKTVEFEKADLNKPGDDKANTYFKDYPLILDDPPRHTHMRQALRKKLLNDEVKKLIPFMRHTAREMVASLKGKSRPDFVKDFAHPYVGRVVSCFLGTEDPAYIPELYHWIGLLESPPPVYDRNYVKALEEANQRQAYYFKKFIRQQRQHRSNTIIAHLLEANIEGCSMSDRELSQILELIALAGFEAPSHALCQAVVHLAHHPGLLKELIKAPEKISLFIEESLRYNAAVHFLFRIARRPVTLANVTIPQGAPVAVNIAAANRDPSRFADPDRFILSRANNREHMAFGFGVHNCLGATLARSLMQIALEAIIENFSEITCPERDSLDWNYSLLAYNVRELPLQLRRRSRALGA